jgi:hypothetical protein
MQGKKDPYAEHNNHCNAHCNHGAYYKFHVSYYYIMTRAMKEDHIEDQMQPE